jgi:hypothetical protein
MQNIDCGIQSQIACVADIHIRFHWKNHQHRVADET